MVEFQPKPGAVLLCGGKGSRFKEVTGDSVPKSLFQVNGKKLIEYSVDLFSPSLFDQLVFAVDYKSEQLEEWVLNSPVNDQAVISYQNKPGVLDAVECALKFLEDKDYNALCNTDEIRLGLSLASALEHHKQSSALGTIVATYTNHLYRHGVISLDKNESRVTSFQLKPEEYQQTPDKVGLVFTGIILLDQRAKELFDSEHDSNWMGIIHPLLDSGQLAAYVAPDVKYFNVGTKTEYNEALSFFENATQEKTS